MSVLIKKMMILFYFFLCLIPVVWPGAVSDELGSCDQDHIIKYIQGCENYLTPPLDLDRTTNSWTPVTHYGCESLPWELRKTIEYIEIQHSNDAYSQVILNFTANPGAANSTIAYIASEFIISRSDWIGNMSRDSIASIIYMGWLENTIKTNSYFNILYPYYISILKKSQTSSLNPMIISCFYHDEDRSLISYTDEILPSEIFRYVKRIEFDIQNTSTSQVFIYFHSDIGIADWTVSSNIADFIIDNPNWKGDRSKISVISEIYLHWVVQNLKPIFMSDLTLRAIYYDFVIGNNDKRESPIQPIHLGYYYEGMNGTPVMDPILRKI